MRVSFPSEPAWCLNGWPKWSRTRLHRRILTNRGKTGEKSLDLGEDEGGGFPLVVDYCHTEYTR